MKIIDRLALLLATSLGLGKIPWAPGTWGSGLGVLLYWITASWPLWGKTLFFLGLTFTGLSVSERVSRILEQKDPSLIVIDEVAGAYLTLLGHPVKGIYSCLGFLFFRLFDIWKPWPVRWAERLSGGLGIMADDIIAGILGSLLLLLIRFIGL